MCGISLRKRSWPNARAVWGKALVQSPPSWSSQPAFPSLRKCSFHRFCAVIGSLPPPRSTPLPLPPGKQGLTSYHHLDNFVSPVCGAGLQNLFGTWKSGHQFLPLCFLSKNGRLFVISVLLAFFQVFSFAFGLNPHNVIVSTTESVLWLDQFCGFV